ncbi:MAG: SDR family oxidoreductase [Pseudomonadota bacterium]
MPTVLITGANRGIGLEFVRQYAASGWRVLACCRQPDQASSLTEISGDIVIHKLDVADVGAVRSLGRDITDRIDVVIANAGLGGRSAGEFGSINFEGWDETFSVNVRGAVATAEAFSPHLKESKGRLAIISSKMGSIADASSGAMCYRSTKSAVNMAAAMIAAELAPSGVAVAPFHPGWVQTDMGGGSAPTTPEESVSGLRALIADMAVTEKPRFLDFTGTEIPW